MLGNESIFELLFLCVILIYASGVWCFFVAWKRYRFSLWWLCIVAILILAPVFLFPLCGNLSYSAAKRSKLSREELEKVSFYNRLGWVLAFCFLLVNLVVRTVLWYVLPPAENILGLSFVLTTFAWTIVSAAFLCALRRM